MSLLRFTILIIALISLLTAFTWKGMHQKQIETIVVRETGLDSWNGTRLGLVSEDSNEFFPITPVSSSITYMGHSDDNQWFCYMAYDLFYSQGQGFVPESPVPRTDPIVYRSFWKEGTSNRDILADGVNSLNVAWSPNCELVAFYRTVEDSSHVFLSSSGGKDVRDLTPNLEGTMAFRDDALFWSPIFVSPDNQWVYFSYRVRDTKDVYGPAVIYRVSLDGRNLQALTSDFGRDVMMRYLSPDGDWLIFNDLSTPTAGSLQYFYILPTDSGSVAQQNPIELPVNDGTVTTLAIKQAIIIGSIGILLDDNNLGQQYAYPIDSSLGKVISPDEQWIYEYLWDGTTLQISWDGTSQQVRPEFTRGSIVGWSSDGQSILFTRRNPTTQVFELRRLTSSGQDEYIRDLPVDSTVTFLNCVWAENHESCLFIGVGRDSNQLSLYRLGRDGEYLKRYISWENDPSNPDYKAYSYVADGPMITQEATSKRLTPNPIGGPISWVRLPRFSRNGAPIGTPSWLE